MGNQLEVDCSARVPSIYDDLHTSLGLSRRKTKKWYSVFEKHSPQGFIDKNDFHVIYRTKLANGRQPTARRVKTDDSYVTELCSTHVFETFDTNCDGTLNFEEFALGVVKIERANTEDKLKWMFDMIDEDRSGYLTLDELRNILVTVQFGSSKSGYPTDTDKLLRVCKTEAGRLISQMDLNKDNRIDFDEFRQTAKSDFTFIYILSRL